MAQKSEEGAKRPKSIHAGHRKRMKQQFLEQGGEHLLDHQLLEMILFYAIPQGDVNPLAHQLMERFGNLHSVFDAPESELKKIVGISDHTAVLMGLISEAARRYYLSEIQTGTIVNDTDSAAEVLRPCFVGAKVEKIYLLSVDAKGKLLGCDRISEGAVDAVLLDQRRVVEKALQRRASQLYLAHCHVNGLAIPSQADLQNTKRLRVALEALGLRLNDHLVFADGDYVSMVQSGLIEGYL
jgi:DNA repair protein RadC